MIETKSDQFRCNTRRYLTNLHETIKIFNKFTQICQATNEIEFLTALLDFGEIKPDIITKDDKISKILLIHPGLKWKVMNLGK